MKKIALLIVFSWIFCSQSVWAATTSEAGDFYHKLLLTLMGLIVAILFIVGSILIYRSFNIVTKMQIVSSLFRDSKNKH